MRISPIHWVVLIAALGSLPSCVSDRAETPHEAVASDRPRVIELPADPYERGRIHGETLQEEIRHQVTLWETDLTQGLRVDAASFIEEFLARTDYLPAIQRWTPDLLEEIRGTAYGSGVPFETMLVFNLLDEVWLNAGDVAGGDHCSALGVPAAGSRPAYVAQNMDIESFRDGSQILLRIEGSGGEPNQLVFTTAGMIGLNGVNQAGVGVVVNALSQLRYAREGLPVAFVVRGLLARTEEAELRSFLTEVSHASGQNYLVGVGEKVFAYEASAGHAVEYKPDNRDGVITHTNHPLVNDDLSVAGRVQITLTAPSDLEAGNTRTRMRALLNRLDAANQVDRGWIEQTLSSRDSPQHPVCRSLGDGGTVFTFGSTIMELGEEPALFLAPGPPDSWEYHRYSFD